MSSAVDAAKSAILDAAKRAGYVDRPPAATLQQAFDKLASSEDGQHDHRQTAQDYPRVEVLSVPEKAARGCAEFMSALLGIGFDVDRAFELTRAATPSLVENARCG